MAKNYIVFAEGYGAMCKKPLATYEEAETAAKKKQVDYTDYSMGIYELIAQTKAPVPEIEVVKVDS